MGRVALEQIWGDISCLYPFYAEDGGNYTKLILENGKELIDTRKTKTVLADLAKFFAVDLRGIKTKYGAKIDRKKGIPIPFHADLVLISVRVRTPQFKDEGAVAYINTEKIESVRDLKKDSGPKTQIIFKNKKQVELLQTPQTVKALLKDADIVRSSFLTLYSSRTNKDLIIQESLQNFLEIMNRMS